MDLETRNREDLKRRNKRLAFGVLGLIVFMEIFPWLYAPLYRQVCDMIGIRRASNKPVDDLLQAINAATGIPGIASSNSMPAKPEPLVTPTTSGAASGLRITPCITAPDTPSARATRNVRSRERRSRLRIA